MFAKLKEALDFARKQSSCHVFAQEGPRSFCVFVNQL
jgi:hypothetical protein